ncbi:hypothetical protein PHYBLDRAFT_157120 [Phycomyces blakesleeanus NRRL 1555(-)]|uniref:CCHC-type zinc finger transcription factor n=1 Tax=Phycomyces blakesleeanus (strain ATCC 8743b / DSM 1359 / FGSC 10004 / NBRC 33097 / NRRL 1555) TaxID=763407 RepID=A0A162VB42_PHYB8|nr:hypothetical protein PHYBLDRAFT_157120 [Phycomyces blakesleeanus NRRL 1555(-)]OAD81372.1 hypothetical protein PHYBLDRAFT_157120 [Phycomyces blakesleeanus NRRL 1555(-)]|eukprot:XP_018299412.1 hypothetical protein PHYBLDRAFT_157120 [Phycomyces blakesleeanus NRRL 1555(-)]
MKRFTDLLVVYVLKPVVKFIFVSLWTLLRPPLALPLHTRLIKCLIRLARPEFISQYARNDGPTTMDLDAMEERLSMQTNYRGRSDQRNSRSSTGRPNMKSHQQGDQDSRKCFRYGQSGHLCHFCPDSIPSTRHLNEGCAKTQGCNDLSFHTTVF